SPVELMEGYLFSPLVEMIVNARRSMPYATPLHLFGAGHPLTLPLSVALGCDTFDSASYMLYAKKERYMTERGTLQLERMTYLPCSCEVCNGTTVSDLRASPREERVRKIALHNLHVLRADVLRCKEAICEGRLWDLVEERANAHTSSAVAFRALVRDHAEWLAKPTSLLKLRGLMVRSEEDTKRPELAVARKHLEKLMAKRAAERERRTAVLVPSSAAPPLTKNSGKIRHVKDLDRADIYRINPQLGPYPAELEFVFPFAQTISDRAAPEASPQACVKRLKKMGYSKVIVGGPAKGAASEARRSKRRP
ncbi:MAG: tRNA-guanine transglycosylase, partial [Nitrososphaerales archaeon]